MLESIFTCWIYLNQLCNLSEIQAGRCVEISACAAGLPLLHIIHICVCVHLVSTHQLDELLVAHLSLFIALDQG